MEPMTDGSTIVFFPEGAFGPTNNCVGIGDVLRKRGHRVVFIIEESFAGTLEEKGFEERLMRLTPPPEAEEVPGQFWKDFIRDTAPVFREPTIEQLGSFIAPTFQALIDGAKYVDDRLLEIFDELRPDVVVEDNVVTFPALITSGIPWVRIASCNPAEIKDHLVPPPFSGLPHTAAPWKTSTLTSTSGARSAARRHCPATTSSTRAPGSTSTSIPRRSTTPAPAPWGPTGTTSRRASAPPTPPGTCPKQCATATTP
jgi:UDP:flavonoid glycosyltransferase YjiC (YdhE family)